jgi:hypothetical protein
MSYYDIAEYGQERFERRKRDAEKGNGVVDSAIIPFTPLVFHDDEDDPFAPNRPQLLTSPPQPVPSGKNGRGKQSGHSINITTTTHRVVGNSPSIDDDGWFELKQDRRPPEGKTSKQIGGKSALRTKAVLWGTPIVLLTVVFVVYYLFDGRRIWLEADQRVTKALQDAQTRHDSFNCRALADTLHERLGNKNFSPEQIQAVRDLATGPEKEDMEKCDSAEIVLGQGRLMLLPKELMGAFILEPFMYFGRMANVPLEHLAPYMGNMTWVVNSAAVVGGIFKLWEMFFRRRDGGILPI